jgi:hypothetical protein
MAQNQLSELLSELQFKLLTAHLYVTILRLLHITLIVFIKEGFTMKFIPFLLILVLILSVFLFPFATPALGIALIATSLAIAVFSILMKHRTAYLQGWLTRTAFVRNTFLDVFGILLAMALAVLLGSYIAGRVAQPISNDSTRLIAGIIVGLLVGLGVGLLVNWTWGRLVKTSPER